MPNDKKSIYIADSYSLNTGDVAILMATVDEIYSTYKNIEVNIESSHPSVLSTYQIDGKIYPRIFDISGLVGVRKNNYFTKCKIIILGIYDSTTFLATSFFYHFGFATNWALRPSRRPQMQAILQSDVWLSSGGGYLSSRYNYWFRFYGYTLALLLRKPYVIFAQSIGPFHSWVARRITKAYLDKASLIMIREPNSLKYINNNLAISKKAILTADIAMLLEKKSSDLTLPKNKIVAVCIKLTNRNYEKTLVTVLKRLQRKGYRLIIISQTPVDDNNAKAIANALGDDCMCITFGLNPKKLKDVYSKCEFIIASRMHAIVFACQQGVPWIGISYEPKFLGLLDQLKGTGFIIPESQLNVNSLNSAIQKVQKIKNYKDTNLVEAFIRNSKKNVIFLDNIL